jgi:hypothetical protein
MRDCCATKASSSVGERTWGAHRRWPARNEEVSAIDTQVSSRGIVRPVGAPVGGGAVHLGVDGPDPARDLQRLPGGAEGRRRHVGGGPLQPSERVLAEGRVVVHPRHRQRVRDLDQQPPQPTGDRGRLADDEPRGGARARQPGVARVGGRVEGRPPNRLVRTLRIIARARGTPTSPAAGCAARRRPTVLGRSPRAPDVVGVERPRRGRPR